METDVVLYSIGGPYSGDRFITRTDSPTMLRINLRDLQLMGCDGCSIHGKVLGVEYSGEMTIREALEIF